MCVFSSYDLLIKSLMPKCCVYERQPYAVRTLNDIERNFSLTRNSIVFRSKKIISSGLQNYLFEVLIKIVIFHEYEYLSNEDKIEERETQTVKT